MNNSQAYRLQQIYRTTVLKQDLQESTELVEDSRVLFQKKLAQLTQKVSKEKNPEKIKALISQADTLFKEYKDSLEEIEEHIDEIDHNIHFHS